VAAEVAASPPPVQLNTSLAAITPSRMMLLMLENSECLCPCVIRRLQNETQEARRLQHVRAPPWAAELLCIGACWAA